MSIEETEKYIRECSDDSQIPATVIRELLDYKDNNLLVAAEFGNELLTKNSNLEQENDNLKSRIDARNEEMEALYNQLAELKANQAILSNNQQNNSNNSSNQKDEESFEVKTIKQKYNLTMEQLKDAALTNKTLIKEIEEKNEQLLQFRAIEKELKEYRSENEKLYIKNDDKDKQILILNEEKIELKRDQRKLNEALKEASTLQYNLENEIKILKKASQSSGEPSKKKIELLQEELATAEELIDEQDKKLNDLQWEKKKYEKLMSETFLRNNELEKERKENLRFLEDARAVVANYRAKEEELELSLNLSSQKNEDNILSELEKEFDTRLSIPENVANKVEKNPEQKAPVGAPENCEEYFFLAVTAVKISCAMRAPVNASGAFRVNPDSLYQQLLEAEIPFHDWYEWIKTQFERKLESFAKKEEQIEVKETKVEEPEGIRAKFARFMNRSKN